MAQKPSQLSHL